MSLKMSDKCSNLCSQDGGQQDGSEGESVNEGAKEECVVCVDVSEGQLYPAGLLGAGQPGSLRR